MVAFEAHEDPAIRKAGDRLSIRKQTTDDGLAVSAQKRFQNRRLDTWETAFFQNQARCELVAPVGDGENPRPWALRDQESGETAKGHVFRLKPQAAYELQFPDGSQ